MAVNFDLAIIGGGPAGYSAAFEASKCGLRTVVFEDKELGGTCLNRGCVPTKYLSHLARMFSEAVNSDDYGFVNNGISVDYIKSKVKLDSIISSQREGIETAFDDGKVKYVHGKARVLDTHTIKCGDVEYTSDNILIATGSRPADPLLSNAITSDQLVKIDRIPQKLNILGGGTIAVEFANAYHMLGSEVSIYIRGDRILRKWDKEIATGITQSFRKKGIKINRNVDFASLAIEDGLILSATGRIPVIPEIKDGLVKVDNGIEVDDVGNTKTKCIYAAGDCIRGSSQLAHIAMEQGRRAVWSMMGRTVKEMSPVVKCIYLDQEVASVGMDEKEATDIGIDYEVAKANMYSNARQLISISERGFVKVLAEKTEGRIIGAHLMCERAGDIVPEFSLAINKKMTVSEMLQNIRPHPSYCEVVTDALKSLEEKICSNT